MRFCCSTPPSAPSAMTARAISIWTRIGSVTRRRSGEIAPFVFAGVQILKPELFADTPNGAFSTNLIWDRLLESERLYGMRHDGLWFHVGTPDSIAEVEERLEVIPPHSES